MEKTKVEKSIFLHSLFRTSSSYFYEKYRNLEECYAYYEPFHQVLTDLTKEISKKLFAEQKVLLKHGVVQKRYFYEYENLIEAKGVSNFQKGYSVDEYCEVKSSTSLKRYIDFLYQNSKKEITVFQFNRSALRISWFKKNYPNASHYYILKNPRNQFESYLSFYKEDKPFFNTMDLMIISKNLDTKFFKCLKKLNIFENFHAEKFQFEYNYYCSIIKEFSYLQLYFMFYFVWFTSLVENILFADYIIDIERLSKDQKYKNDLHKNLKKLKNETFDDFKYVKKEIFTLSSNEMENVEFIVKTMVFAEFDEGTLQDYTRKLVDYNIKIKNIDYDNQSFSDKEIDCFFEWKQLSQKLRKKKILYKILNNKAKTTFLIKNILRRIFKIIKENA